MEHRSDAERIVAVRGFERRRFQNTQTAAKLGRMLMCAKDSEVRLRRRQARTLLETRGRVFRPAEACQPEGELWDSAVGAADRLAVERPAAAGVRTRVLGCWNRGGARCLVGRHAVVRQLIVLTLLLPSIAFAGTYELIVSESSEPSCSAAAPDPAYHSAAEVVADIQRHFSGETTEIDIFVAAFQNARVKFCSAGAREVVEQALVDWVIRGPKQHERHLYDYLLMLGSKRLDEQLATLQHEHSDDAVGDRIGKARSSVQRGLQIRSD